MSNVIHFAPRVTQMIAQGQPARHGALVSTFAKYRRLQQDVFWLKENAELLSIFESTNLELSKDSLTAYEPFYFGVCELMEFFPQYYRFYMSISLNLEALGMQGDEAARICRNAVRLGCVDAELSDLQRAEAARLLGRRKIEVEGTEALYDRLRRFCAVPQTFAVPNRKAAYELTHIVFYLSDYGRHSPELPQTVRTSLHYAGCVAHLEENADLLAEICIALQFAGWAVPKGWQDWLSDWSAAFQVVADPQMADQDQYHTYLMCNWQAALNDTQSFYAPFSGQAEVYVPGRETNGVLRCVSSVMYNLKGSRSKSWDVMAPQIMEALPSIQQAHLSQVVEAAPDFAGFFSIFARANSVPAPADAISRVAHLVVS